MNYILLAGVVGLALVIGYLVGRTVEAVRRERRDIERGATRLTDVRWEDEDVYTAYEREARKRGKGV